MIKLRTLLLSKWLYIIIFFIVSLISFFRIKIGYKSSLNKNVKSLTGIVTKINYKDCKTSILLKVSNEYINGSYYGKLNFMLGDKVKVYGGLNEIDKLRVPNTFDYKKYAYRNKIFYTMHIDKIKYISKSNNIIFILKNNINKYFDLFKNKKYLKLVLLGNKDEVDKKYINAMRNVGISHLFAISGMHVGFITDFILKVLKKLKIEEEKRYFIAILFLALYTLLIGFSPSIIRAFLFFTLLSINKIYYFYVDSISIFILTLSITLLINPFFIFDIGFIYSFLISFTLILGSNLLNKYSNYIIKLFLTSLISFLVSLPVTLYNFYSINLLSIIYNLFYVPFVTYILFPSSIIVLLFPILEPIYNILILVLEKSLLFLNNIDTYLIVGKLNISVYIIYVLLILLFIYFDKKAFIILYVLIFIFHYNFYNIFDKDYITMIDVGQGDSFLIHSKNKSMLIDTGGKMVFKGKNNHEIALNRTLPYLKSKGIRKLDFLVLTHGDADHMGEARSIAKNFKVNKVYINSNRENYLEKDLKKIIKVDKLKEGDEIELGNFYFIELNKNLNGENSSSNVLYGEYKNINMLFTGDANFESEKYILKNYDLPRINILKVGHHGSKTSTSNALLKVIKPKYALISAGVNNKFNHPSKDTIKRLKDKNVKILDTKRCGTIEIDLTNDLKKYEF